MSGRCSVCGAEAIQIVATVYDEKYGVIVFDFVCEDHYMHKESIIQMLID